MHCTDCRRAGSAGCRRLGAKRSDARVKQADAKRALELYRRAETGYARDPALLRDIGWAHYIASDLPMARAGVAGANFARALAAQAHAPRVFAGMRCRSAPAKALRGGQCGT